MTRVKYPSDLNDKEWRLLESYVPVAKPGGRPHKWPMRTVVDAIFYIVRGGIHGFDGAKQVNGRKRHLLVDTLGMPLVVKVQSAEMPDREGAKPVLQEGHRRFPALHRVWADQGYTGQLIAWAKPKIKLTLADAGDRQAAVVGPGARRMVAAGCPTDHSQRLLRPATPLGRDSGADVRLAGEVPALEQGLCPRHVVSLAPTTPRR
jgi:transposase